MRNLIQGLLVLLMFGCSHHKEIGAVTFEEIGAEFLTGAGEEGIQKENFVIQDKKSWNELLVKMNRINHISDSITEHEIDFSKNTLIAVFDKVKSTGGYELDLKITRTTENLVVTIMNTIPEGMATMVMTQPFYIVKIPKTQEVIVFNIKK